MHVKRLLIIFYLLLINFIVHTQPLPFKKVIIWGHKLHSHTHSYVHYGFYKAFKYLGYDTYWFDNNEQVQDFDFAHSLFITEGQVDHNMPLRDDCRYILHNCHIRTEQKTKYGPYLEKGICIKLCVYVNNAEFDIHRPTPAQLAQLNVMDKYVQYHIDARFIEMPWATDLLPYEIDEIKKQINTKKRTKQINWVGTIGGPYYGPLDQLIPFRKACKEKNIPFNHITNASPSKNITLIQESLMAPSIQGEWQIKNGYIPCRIFKNISYGQFGITNSKTVYELFEKKIIYNPNTYQLFYDAVKRMKNMHINELYDLMDFVKTKHTYLNRIKNLLEFLHMVKPLDNHY